MLNLEHLFTEDNHQIRETIRKFTQEEIIPIAHQLEADYGMVKQVHQKLVDIGIQSSGYPVEYGSGGNGSFTNTCILAEELPKGDAGISLSASINSGIIRKSLECERSI